MRCVARPWSQRYPQPDISTPGGITVTDHEICILTADFHMATDMSYDDNALVPEM